MKLNRGVVISFLDGEWIAYDGEAETMYQFNEVGGEILMAIQEGKKTKEEIVGVILNKFEVNKKQLRNDLEEFLDKMKSQGLVVE